MKNDNTSIESLCEDIRDMFADIGGESGGGDDTD